MENKNQQAYHPPTTNGYTRSDAEAAAPNAEELRRQKRKKWIIYGAAFVVFQTAIIVIFSLTIMKVKTPKFRVRSASIDGGPLVTGQNSPFNFNTTFQLGVKNTNFGPYKYDKTTVFFYYGNTQVGSADFPKSKANFLSTKKVTISVNLSGSAPVPSNTSATIVTLRSEATLKGKVELMLMFKKKKSVNMNCTMEYRGTDKDLQNIQCK